jgi:hypothetical protein
MKQLSTSRQLLRHSLSFVAGIFVVLNQLTSSLRGVLVLLLLVYFGVPLFTDIQFWTIDQTFRWALALPPDNLMTGASIIAAYAIAVSTWRQQKAFEIRLANAWSLASFFHEAVAETHVIQRFANALLEVRQAIAKGDQEGADSWAQMVLGRRAAFIKARDSISQRAIDIHELRGRFEGVVANSFAPDMALIAAERALATVAEGMWFNSPYVADSPEKVSQFISGADADGWNKFERQADRSIPAMTAGANGLIVIAQGRLFAPTLWSLARMWRRAKIFMAEAE